MVKLSTLLILEKQLNVGTNTVDDLVNVGSKEVWLKLKK